MPLHGTRGLAGVMQGRPPIYLILCSATWRLRQTGSGFGRSVTKRNDGLAFLSAGSDYVRISRSFRTDAAA